MDDEGLFRPAAKRQKLSNGQASAHLDCLSSAGDKFLHDAVATLAAAWSSHAEGSYGTDGANDEGKPCKANITPLPFRALQVDGLFDDKLLREVRAQLLDTVRYTEHSSDLFSYCGSSDLADADTVPPDTSLARLRDALYSPPVINLISSITGVRLNKNGKPDLSSHIYRPGDFLACHDDDIKGEQEGRRIAFILYLVEDEWNPAMDGGELRLFGSDSSGDPAGAVEDIAPRFNRLALFEVSSISFHEVADVFGTRDRLSISGWYGGRLRERLIHSKFDSRFSSHPSLDYLKQTIDKRWYEPDGRAQLRNQMRESSVVTLSPFLKAGTYDSWQKEFAEKAKAGQVVGPASVRRYRLVDPDAQVDIIELFKSQAFCTFLCDITDATPARHRVQGRLFEPSDYTLIHDQARDPAGLDVIFGLQPAGSEFPTEGKGDVHYVVANDAEVDLDDDEDMELARIAPGANVLHIVLRDEASLKFVSRVKANVEVGVGRLDVEAVYELKEDETE